MLRHEDVQSLASSARAGVHWRSALAYARRGTSHLPALLCGATGLLVCLCALHDGAARRRVRRSFAARARAAFVAAGADADAACAGTRCACSAQQLDIIVSLIERDELVELIEQL